MHLLILKSYLLLLRVELLMHVRNLQALHELVRRQPISEHPHKNGASDQQISHAMDLACVFYPKYVLCLQRSTATTLLMRGYGYSAEMVIGTQLLPPKFHAWVEINNIVVNDKPYMHEIYQQLERC